MDFIARLCPRKWLMLFSLKFQRNNQQNALTIGFAKEKPERKGCIFTTLWDETTAYYDRAFLFINRKLEQSHCKSEYLPFSGS